MSPGSPYTTATVGSRCLMGKGRELIDACVQPNDGNRGPWVMLWGAIHDGGRSELVVVEGAMNRHCGIVMIMFEMMASRWIINQKHLCWDLDTKYNHEMEYDSRMFVSDPLVSLICLNLQCIFRKSLVYYTDAAFLWIKNVKRTSYEKAADLSTSIRQIFMNNYMSMI